ncbi:hypothetical protein JCM11491_001899 [Sporobolomyces phaffii]
MRQSKLDFGASGSSRRSHDSDSPEPESSPAPTAKLRRRQPVQKAFNHGRKEEGYISGGEDVSDSDHDVRLTAVAASTAQPASRHGSDSSTDSDQDSDDDDDEEDSEAMMDLEAEDDEDYQSGDSLDEDDGGNARKRDKSKNKDRRKGKARAIELDGDGSDVEIVTPEKKAKNKKRRIVESDADSDVVVRQPVASTSRATSSISPTKRPPTTKRKTADRAGTNADSDSDRPIRPPSSTNKKSKGSKRVVLSSSSSSPGSDSNHDTDADPPPEPKSRRNPRKNQQQKRSRPDGSESPQQRKKKKVVVKRKLKKLTTGNRTRRSADELEDATSEESSFVVDDDAEVEEDEWNESEREKVLGSDEARRRRKEEEAIRERDKESLRQKRLARENKIKGKAKAVTDSEEDEEPVRSGRRNGSATLKAVDDDDDDDDDLEILDEETILEQRLRGSKSSVASKFEAIRAARANRGSSSQQPIVLDSDNEDPISPDARAPRPTYMGQSESEEEQDEESDDSGGSVDAGVSDENDFIVSDEDAGGDVEEARKELDKLRDSMRVKAQGLKYFLKTYLNYLVHLICVPESRWLADDEFKTAKNKIETHLKGIISSALSSAGWLAGFKRIVDTRPDLSLDAISDLPPCDACAQGKYRRATFCGTFSGAKYNPETLQLLTPSEDESEPDLSSSDESASDAEAEVEKDFFGRDKPKNARRNRKVRSCDKTYEYNLGKHCAGRTEVYHMFRHWPYATKLRLEQKVLPLQDKTIKRAKKKPGMTEAEYKDAIRKVRKKREADASRIAAELDRRGVISDFATTLDNELDRAIKAFST